MREKVGTLSLSCSLATRLPSLLSSTLAMSLLRFVEPTSGNIRIDGIDITQAGLTQLRSRVQIIPQDPTVLSGKLRSTLDVFDEYDDAAIFEALRRVHLLKPEDSLEADGENRNRNVFLNLDADVSEGGDNFSQGEKQLLCLARSILRNPKILIMDEATASIDCESTSVDIFTMRIIPLIWFFASAMQTRPTP